MSNGQEFNTQGNNDFSLPKPPTAVSGGPSVPNDVSGVYGALKCYFFTPKRGDVWGAFCIMFDGATGELMETVFWVTRLLTGQAIDVNMQWRSLNKMIPQMGVYEKTLGDKLSVLLPETFSSAVRIELCRSQNNAEQIQAVCEEIRNAFERTTHCFLEFKMAFERMSAQDLANAGVLLKDGGPVEMETDKIKAEEKSFAGTLINCLPVIDPVYGRPVSELKPGDILEVRMQGGVGVGDMIQKFLTSTNQDAIFPIESIEKPDADKTYIFLQINEELKGLITVTKDLRLRVLELTGQKKTSITINTDNLIFFGVLAVASVVIIMAVRFLLF